MRVLVIRPRRLLGPIGLCACFAVLIALGALLPFAPKAAKQTLSKSAYTGLDTNEKRIKLLESFGLEPENAPKEVVQVTIPRKFDPVYEAYNDLQKPLGLDLKAYRGKTVLRYTYVVKNVESESTVLANLLLCDDALIGGDLSSADPSGLARPLSGEA